MKPIQITTEELAMLIGAKEIELMTLRKELASASKTIDELNKKAFNTHGDASPVELREVK